METTAGVSGRTRAVAWLLVLAAAVGFAIWHWGDGPGPSAADYAQYLAHARALAEGRPYTDTGYIFTTLYPYSGPEAQPIGLPVVVFLVFKVVGQSMLAVRVVLLALALAFYLMAGKYFADHEDWRLGVAVALLLGLSTDAAHWSTVVQSDLPFCALVWGVIYLYDRDGPFTWTRLALISALGAGALLFRTFGVALIPAVLLYALLHIRKHGIRPALPAAVWTAALLLLSDLPTTAGFAPKLQAFLASLPRMIPHQALSYRFGLFAAHLYPFPWNHANDVYHVLAAIVMLCGLAIWLRGAYRTCAVAFAAVYVAMLMVVPVLDTRYMWPVYPVLAFGLVKGLAFLAGMVRPALAEGRRMRFALGATAAIGVLSVASSEKATPRELTFTRRADVQDIFRNLTRLDSTATMRVAFVRPQVLALETGIPSMTTFPAPEAAIIRELDHSCINHVVLGDAGLAPRADSAFRQVVRLHPDGFQLEYRNPSFAVYRFTALDCRRPVPPRRRPSR